MIVYSITTQYQKIFRKNAIQPQAPKEKSSSMHKHIYEKIKKYTMNKKFPYCYDIVSYFNLATLLPSLPREASPRASIATPGMAMPINNFSPKKGSIPFTGYGLEVTGFSLPCDA